MDDVVEELNYNCNYNMFLVRILLPELKKDDERSLVLKWINRLARHDSDVPSMQLRNELMYHLVLHVQRGCLALPFNRDPPPDLASAAHLVNAGGAGEDTLPIIYQNSPDGGMFLAAQPVPRCGAFCYLAVISNDS